MRPCEWGWINLHPYKCESTIHCEDGLVVRKDKITADFIQGGAFMYLGFLQVKRIQPVKME